MDWCLKYHAWFHQLMNAEYLNLLNVQFLLLQPWCILSNAYYDAIFKNWLTNQHQFKHLRWTQALQLSETNINIATFPNHKWEICARTLMGSMLFGTFCITNAVKFTKYSVHFYYLDFVSVYTEAASEWFTNFGFTSRWSFEAR